MASNGNRRVYRPTRKLRPPPASLTPAQKQAYTRMRLIECFVNDFVAALPRDVYVSALEFPHYCSFAKQVWRLKDTVQNQQGLARKIEIRIGHWSEIGGLKEPVLRSLSAEVLVTELAMASDSRRASMC
jgi:hypothetical protein